MLNDIKSVNDIIKNAKEFDKFRYAVESFDVLEKMEEIFPEIKAFVIPKKVEGKTLFIRVTNSVMRSELSINRNKMIEKINKFFKKEVITNIKFI